jgi:hypothetical protein
VKFKEAPYEFLDRVLYLVQFRNVHTCDINWLYEWVTDTYYYGDMDEIVLNRMLDRWPPK